MRELCAIYLYGAGEDSDTIARIYYDLPDDTKERAAAIRLVATTDAEQAERWRLLFAAGEIPDLSADPPIEEFEEQDWHQLARELR